MVSLIIVDYKSIEKTLGYLHEFYGHVEESSKEKIHPVIVDNSQDNTETLEVLRRETKDTLSKIHISLERKYCCI